MQKRLDKVFQAVSMLLEKPRTADAIACQVGSKRDTVWEWLSLMKEAGLAEVCGTEKIKGKPGNAAYLWRIKRDA